jgi:hypothetical protein
MDFVAFERFTKLLGCMRVYTGFVWSGYDRAGLISLISLILAVLGKWHCHLPRMLPEVTGELKIRALTSLENSSSLKALQIQYLWTLL